MDEEPNDAMDIWYPRTSPVAHGREGLKTSSSLSDSFGVADGQGRETLKILPENTPMRVESVKHMQHQPPRICR
jgi:hypothetical protein